MVADCHEVPRAAFADIHAPLHLVIDILPAPAEEYPGVRIADKHMGLAEFFGDILHIRHRFKHKTVHPARGNIINKLRVITVGGEHDFFAAFNERREILFVVRKNILPVPVRVNKRAGSPDYIVMHHHHRHISSTERVKILLNPGSVAVSHRAEAFRVRPRRHQQHFPAEQVNQPGHAGYINTRHVHRVRHKIAVEPVVPFVLFLEFFFIPLAENRPRVKHDHFLRCFKRAGNHTVIINAACRVNGVPHSGFRVAENAVSGQGTPQKVIIPRRIKGLLRLGFQCPRA